MPHPWLFVSGFPIFFVAVWMLACWGVSLVGGWHALAKRYVSTAAFPARSRSMESGYMRLGAHYNQVLRLGSDGEGLHLAVMPLFRLGHPHLRIPWSDIDIQAPRFVWFFFERQTLLLGPEKISLTVAKNLITFLRAGNAARQP